MRRTIFIFLAVAGLSTCSAFSTTCKLRHVSTWLKTSSSSDNGDDKAEEPSPSLKENNGFWSKLRQPQDKKTSKIDTGNPWYHRRQRKREAKALDDMMVGLRGGLRQLPLAKAKKPGTLILVRHGQSEGAKEGRFIGWSDPPLTPQGIREAQHAARLLRESGYDISVVFTSYLNRAIHSTWAIVRELDESYLPVFKSWRLMERSYGALTGLSKSEVASLMGVTRVQTWRTDPHAVPPPMSENDKNWPGKRHKFAGIKSIPASESLVDCTKRLQPLWQNKIVCELEAGHNVLVVGHGSTLRGIIQYIQGLSDEEAFKVQVPPGSPIVYDFDRNMQPIPSKDAFSVQEGLLGMSSQNLDSMKLK
jgi:2,3-bisphosphoglycerate-dependent phosphoglycerate mutase